MSVKKKRPHPRLDKWEGLTRKARRDGTKAFIRRKRKGLVTPLNRRR